MDDDYEDALREQKDLRTPEIVVYRPDEDDEDKPFCYQEILELIKDGVLDTLVPNENGILGVSANDLRALNQFVKEASDAWRCVDRLEVNRITETKTVKYKLTE